MFDLPDAKRVRRSDLNNPSASSSRANSRSSSLAPEAAADLQARLASLYDPVPYVDIYEEAPYSRPTPRPSPEPETVERSYEFHLFSTTSAQALPPTIVLEVHKDAEGTGAGGFVVPERGAGYYIVAPAEGEGKRRYEFAAVDGETVAQWASRRNWGLEVPWRVNVIRQPLSKLPRTQTTTSILSADTIASAEDEEARKKRIKPNKKRRIILRRKLKLKVEKEDERKKKDAEKEEAEREKRTRRNREKKVKKKLKEKAKKLAGGAVTGKGGVGAEIEGVEGSGRGE